MQYNSEGARTHSLTLVFARAHTRTHPHAHSARTGNFPGMNFYLWLHIAACVIILHSRAFVACIFRECIHLAVQMCTLIQQLILCEVEQADGKHSVVTVHVDAANVRYKCVCASGGTLGMKKAKLPRLCTCVCTGNARH